MPDTLTAPNPAPARAEPRRPRRPGRPAGSTTTPAPSAAAVAAACPQCNATAHEVLRKLPDQAYAGMLNGRAFTSIERRRCRCSGCGQHFMRIDYPFDPKAWQGPLPN